MGPTVTQGPGAPSGGRWTWALGCLPGPLYHRGAGRWARSLRRRPGVFVRSATYARKASGRRSGRGKGGNRVGVSPLRPSPFPLLPPVALRTAPGPPLRSPKPKGPPTGLEAPYGASRPEGREGPVPVPTRPASGTPRPEGPRERRGPTAVRGASCAYAPPGTPGRRDGAPRTWTAPGAAPTAAGPGRRSLWPPE